MYWPIQIFDTSCLNRELETWFEGGGWIVRSQRCPERVTFRSTFPSRSAVSAAGTFASSAARRPRDVQIHGGTALFTLCGISLARRGVVQVTGTALPPSLAHRDVELLLIFASASSSMEERLKTALPLTTVRSGCVPGLRFNMKEDFTAWYRLACAYLRLASVPFASASLPPMTDFCVHPRPRARLLSRHPPAHHLPHRRLPSPHLPRDLCFETRWRTSRDSLACAYLHLDRCRPAMPLRLRLCTGLRRWHPPARHHLPRCARLHLIHQHLYLTTAIFLSPMSATAARCITPPPFSW
ncbi:hypothetical protein C8R45DRAFT_1112414 [Mycena sanguinolenta]|nr:hypothetical protein C8R45DRAFT_1112414 [Mycena sanguinolenta]